MLQNYGKLKFTKGKRALVIFFIIFLYISKHLLRNGWLCDENLVNRDVILTELNNKKTLINDIGKYWVNKMQPYRYCAVKCRKHLNILMARPRPRERWSRLANRQPIVLTTDLTTDIKFIDTSSTCYTSSSSSTICMSPLRVTSLFLKSGKV